MLPGCSQWRMWCLPEWLSKCLPQEGGNSTSSRLLRDRDAAIVIVQAAARLFLARRALCCTGPNIAPNECCGTAK